MYDRMVHEHGYSIRKLADKLGKDKGYLENRLRLADAPPEIRELVSLRKDSLSHAYELMKVEDPKKRRRLAEQVARGELTLIKLRDKIEGRRPRAAAPFDDGVADIGQRTGDETDASDEPADASWTAQESTPTRPLTDDSLVNAKQGLVEAVDELIGVLGDPEVRGAIGVTDRANLAKYLTIAKLRLENAIAMVRSDDAGY
jgi:ParB-like chromosome segregation protein Spo0J